MTGAVARNLNGHGAVVRRAPSAQCGGADAGSFGSDGLPPPVRFDPSVRYEKAEVFEICAALALAEVVLRRLDRPVEAARMAAVFELVEDRLSR